MLRIYGETVPFEVVVRARTIALLQRHALELVLAVRPVRENPDVSPTSHLEERIRFVHAVTSPMIQTSLPILKRQSAVPMMVQYRQYCIRH